MSRVIVFVAVLLLVSPASAQAPRPCKETLALQDRMEKALKSKSRKVQLEAYLSMYNRAPPYVTEMAKEFFAVNPKRALEDAIAAFKAQRCSENV